MWKVHHENNTVYSAIIELKFIIQVIYIIYRIVYLDDWHFQLKNISMQTVIVHNKLKVSINFISNFQHVQTLRYLLNISRYTVVYLDMFNNTMYVPQICYAALNLSTYFLHKK